MRISSNTKGKMISLIVIIIFLFIFSPINLSGARKENQMIQSLQIIHYVGGTGPGNYTQIQDAIDNASNGEMIYVYNGTYFEHVIITKSIILIGENKDSTIIHGENTGDVPCVKIMADNVVVKNFHVIWADWEYHEPGFEIYSDNVIIKHNNISIHDKGIILFPSAKNCTITHNIFSNNHESIMLSLQIGSNYHMIKNNYFYNNDYAIKSPSSNHNTISNNIILKTAFTSILLINSEYNTIVNNTISESSRGLISDAQSKNNKIYHNNFVSNTVHVVDAGNNQWNQINPDGGNYWDDYIVSDMNNDGVGDQPYLINGGSNKDNYPYLRKNQWNEKPLTVQYSGPSEGFIHQQLQFTTIIEGGLPPYYCTWSLPTYQIENNTNPYYIFNTSGIYTISVQVIDSIQNTAEDNYNITIYENDTIPPELNILKPTAGIYSHNQLICPINAPLSLIYGPLTIEVTAFDNQSRIKSIALFINDKQITSTENNTLLYYCPESLKGWFSISSIAIDLAGNNAMTEKQWILKI